jgi:predicted outer membrane protein
MKPVSAFVLAMVAIYSSAGSARAETVPVRHAAALFAPTAAANTKRMTPQQRDEWRFLKDAAATSRFESEAARLALARSSDPGVRSFAATLINHHATAGNELLYMLHVRGMAPPMLANDQRKTLNRLAKLQGGKFDREFMAEVGLRYQHEDVQYFEKARLVAGEPALKAWIERNLPTLRYHLATAERLAPSDLRFAKLGASAKLAANRDAARASLATRSMGAPPAPESMTGGFLQLGSGPAAGISPLAARPIESSIR